MTTTSITEAAEELGIPEKDLEYLCKKAEQNLLDLAKELSGKNVSPLPPAPPLPMETVAELGIPEDGLEYLHKRAEQNIFSLPDAL